MDNPSSSLILPLYTLISIYENALYINKKPLDKMRRWQTRGKRAQSWQSRQTISEVADQGQASSEVADQANELRGGRPGKPRRQRNEELQNMYKIRRKSASPVMVQRELDGME